MTQPAQTAAALRGRQADSARRRDRVLKAISAAAEAGQEITASSIARAAGVDRTFLYRHRDLIEQIHAAHAQAPAAAGPGPAATTPHCRPTCSTPSNEPPASPSASSSSNTGSPTCSASAPGVNPGSALPPASTRSRSKTSPSSSTSSTYASSSKSATRTSLPPAPPTASSWPS